MSQTIKKTLFVLITFIAFSCSEFESLNTPKSLEVQNFIWKGLNLHYLWQADIANLSDTRFKNQSQLNDFLSKQSNPNTLFESLLYQRGSIDKWSYLFNDYDVLEQWLSGTAATHGMEFELLHLSGSENQFFGVVRYVLPNSDADKKGIKRGMIFNRINGSLITKGENGNYRALYNSTSFTIGLANYNNGDITSNSESYTLNQTAYAENPILLNKTINIEDKKIGYLMYNGFYNEFDLQLNNEFGKLKSENINELVLDLRYNSGGSVRSAIYLASMITGQFNGQLFLKQQWNAKVEKYILEEDKDGLNDYFVNKINETTINSLNLNKVYVLTSTSTASASELLINCLKPYIEVITIGDVTTGKNVGSVTLYDAIDFSKEKRSNNHKYAMQPIVLRTLNKNGFGSYEKGLTPTHLYKENPGDLGILGNETEPMLAMAIQLITGKTPPALAKRNNINFNHFIDSKSIVPVKTDMYIDLPKGILRNIE